MRSASLVCWVVLLVPGVRGQEKSDPVAALKAVIRRMETEGTKERVTNFLAPNKWVKRKAVARDVKFDVRKTDSLLVPYAADVTWVSAAYLSPEVPTKEEAEKAKLPATPFAPKFRHWAKLSWRDGVWVPDDLGWRSGNLAVTHSTLTDKRNPIHDWWLALGGK